MAEQYTNLASSTTSGLSNTTDPVTFSVATGDGAKFPATTNGSFRIIVDSEILLVTSRTTDSMTASRAQEGTTAASHSAASIVTHVLTAGAMDQIRKDLVQTGTVGSIPPAQKAGNLYFESNGLNILRDSGAAQVAFGPIWPITPPVSANWTQMNAGSTTYTSSADRMTISPPIENNVNLRGWSKSAPAVGGGGIWQCTFGISYWCPIANFPRLGVAFKEAATNKVVSFGPYPQGGVSFLAIDRWTNLTTYSTTPTNGAVTLSNPQWFRLKYDGTNVIFQVSADGFNFYTYYSEAKTAGFTTAPDQVCFFMTYNSGQTVPISATMFSYLEESL